MLPERAWTSAQVGRNSLWVFCCFAVDFNSFSGCRFAATRGAMVLAGFCAESAQIHRFRWVHMRSERSERDFIEA